MCEIREIPYNGFRVISLFSGCGGSSLGYRLEGFKVVWANEFIPIAVDTYELNFPDTVVDRRDIRKIDSIPIDGEIDILDGSPPCASFSTAGQLDKGWGKVKQYSETKQRTDDLFWEYIRILEMVRPRVFIAENTGGLIKGKAKGFFKDILKALKATGYMVRAKVLDAQWLGVCQTRKRLIFIGTRDGKTPVYPKPLPYFVPLKTICPNIVRYKGGGAPNTWKPATHPFGTVTQMAAQTSISAYLSANGFIETTDGEVRKLTISELKTVCGFPDDFRLIGKFEQQWERLGRAVPPPMMEAIASTIRDNLL